MKITLPTTICSLVALLTSCSPLGLYTTKHVQKSAEQARTRGISEGRSLEVRAQYRREQQERERPQSVPSYYNIPVAAHTLADGTKFDAHEQTIQIQSY